jgi:ATP-dependent DNA ligase
MTLFPPRPASKILPAQLERYEKSGKWVAQRKFNGTHLTIHVKDGKVRIFNYGEVPALFVLSPKQRQEFLSLNIDPTKEYWLDGELLDHKTTTPEYKGKIVLFDVLQAGEYLFKSLNLLDRYALLQSICGNPQKLEPNHGIALAVSDSVWLAETFYDNFRLRYEEYLAYPEIEGLVLKNKNSFIDNFGQKKYEVGWLIRCRKATKNYAF